MNTTRRGFLRGLLASAALTASLAYAPAAARFKREAEDSPHPSSFPTRTHAAYTYMSARASLEKRPGYVDSGQRTGDGQPIYVALAESGALVLESRTQALLSAFWDGKPHAQA